MISNTVTANEWVDCFSGKKDWNVETAAMLLALTWTLADEEKIKGYLDEQGFKYVVTEIGGTTFGEFQKKTTRAVLGACLNAGLIKKTSPQAHAVLHAAEEAKKGIMVNASSSTSIAVKIAIVRNDNWVAVAIFGQSAIHPLTNHLRAGLGVMHISDD
ncbi:MAG TPA: HutP family protein [Clostridia bacterium]|nr:HutP family protein [Clostridia bacterium]